MADRRTHTSSPSRGRRLRLVARLCAWGMLTLVAAAYAMGEFGADVWWMELFSHFRPHMVLALIACFALFLCARARIGAVVCGTTLALGLLSVAGWFLPSESARASGDRLRLCVSNVLTNNTRFEETLDGIYALAPDLAVLIEVNEPMVDKIEADPRWRVEFADVKWYSGWVVIIAPVDSPVRIDHAESVELTPGTRNIPAVDVRLTFDGRPLRLLGVHARSPVSETNARHRNEQLVAVTNWVTTASDPAPAVVAGDLNTTVWSPKLRALEDYANLENSMRGRGLVGTWPSAMPGFLRVGIDHVLHDRRLVTISRTVGDAGGSDHAPVLVELAWRDSD